VQCQRHSVTEQESWACEEQQYAHNATNKNTMKIMLRAAAATTTYIQVDQKVSKHLMIGVQNTQKYFEPFQSLTMMT
jgi:hypothetical protein